MDKDQRKALGHRNREWGAEAEQIAGEYFIKEGYIIRERNYRIGNHLEIDLILEKERTLIFVEVKSRMAGGQDPVEAVNYRKRNKMIRGADIYLRQQQFRYQYRFDIVTLTGNRDNYELKHYADAFLPQVNGSRRR